MSDFFAKNIEIKEQYLQLEHRKVLEVVFKDMEDQKCVANYSFVSGISQCMTFSNILKQTGFESGIVTTCLCDLEKLGLICNVMHNPNKEYSYALTKLGLKYIELNRK